MKALQGKRSLGDCTLYQVRGMLEASKPGVTSLRDSRDIRATFGGTLEFPAHPYPYFPIFQRITCAKERGCLEHSIHVAQGLFLLIESFVLKIISHFFILY